MALGLIGLAVFAVVLILASGLAGGTTAQAVYDEEYVSGDGAAKVAVVPVEGTIASADDSLGGTQPTVTPEGLADALRQASGDPSVAAVVLEVNSPGGGVTASDEMHQGILDFKENTGKPVVISMGDTAASGGYYISTAADRIVANETTLTGSLGVIFQLTNFAEAADKYGIKQEVIKSGKYKDIGNSFREMKPEEREIFQSIVDESYSEFVDVISEGRDIPEERVREIADGRVYSGLQAEELGLVDSFGGLDEASVAAGRLAGTEDTTVVRYVQEPTLTDTLLARLAPQEPQAEQIMEAAGLNLEPKPYYLYRP
ncbi:Protease IV (Signal peptide peptidase) [uncultured Rubrobacteraceae bacterium]|uniref:Protease IV (Signal peptide peptidase) n=1 Tax=uncultured Rubrobacteraceae bacterium TaxID=349277 RepID=A0A6J4PGL2_9ACTN|nr:Protease IV (Signal peptide peptidase) [uncultured Rubrobacteraceae bacterium]